jgi:glycosyltransferase involved in cell wall biosynthesis
VTWTGRLDDTSKRQLLDAAAVLVMCSDTESFGMSVAEAMAAGRPVVVTRTCPWSDVESHHAGFWVEQRPDAVAAGINAVFWRTELPPRHGMPWPFARSHRQYSWPHAAAALITEYKAIAADTVHVG